ncbi:ribose-phosphate pyrophosphokinase [Gammaproteobacteria bacterium]|nr:ribose-phosphate pyrophosphokinase [Gammaproteobacteria bacterium]
MVDIKSSMIFSGNANKALAKSVAKNLGITLGKASVKTFSDGEISVEIDENVRGQDVYIIQPLCDPVNNNLMELLIMVDALKRSSVDRISVVLPYFGYSRQDRRARSARVPITAKVVANMLTSMGVERLLTIDLHADQIQGFFDIPVDNIYATPLFLADIHKQNYKDTIIVSPDVGGVVRARALAKQLNSDLAIVDKRRPEANVSEVMQIIGDVKGKCCIIVDDICDTAGTLCHAADALKEQGASSVFAYITHPIFSGKANQNISNSTIDGIIVTDTISLSKKIIDTGKIRQITVAQMLAETLRRIDNKESVSSLFIE